MKITELVWNLFLVLLPGVVSTLMVRYVTTNKKYSIFDFVINSAVLGVGTFVLMELSISLYWLVVGVFDKSISTEFGLNLSIWDNLFDGNKKLNKNEMFISYLIAIPAGFLWGLMISKKFIIKIFKKLKLTNRYGDDDVWSFFLTSSNVDWVYLHNKEMNITYFGKIRAYSESSEKREIVLEDVIVYESTTWTEKYQTNAVFLELKDFEFTIESPKIIEENEPNANN